MTASKPGVAIVLGAIACAGVSRSAHADHWYGEQTVGSDAVSYALLGTGVGLEQPYVGIPGGVLWVLGPPAIHISHGKKGRAALSLGGRLLLPLVGGLFVGSLSYDGGGCTDPLCVELGDGAGVGFVLGMIAASVLDAVIAREDDEEPDAVMFAVGGGF
jgi:hypothetical protein